MSEPLDFQKLESLCWRALCRHHVSERQMVVSATIIRLSFVIGEPSLTLRGPSELSELTNISRGNVHTVLAEMKDKRALEVSEDRRVFTFMPSSRNWPWLFKLRMREDVADERERAIIWAAKGPKQSGFYFDLPEAGQEFAAALAIEKMRESLSEYHRAAVARLAGYHFPVTDCSPTTAPAPRLSGGEEPTQPLGTTGAGALSSVENFTPGLEDASVIAAPQTGSQIGNAVPDSDQIVPDSGTTPLKGFKGLKDCTPLSFESFKGTFPNREQFAALDPGATEEQIIAWLRRALGKMCGPCFDARRRPCKCAKPEWVPVMDKLGGWWRLRIRESRWAAINVCMELFLRLTDTTAKPLRNPGGWARDQYFKIRGERPATETTTNAPTHSDQ